MRTFFFFFLNPGNKSIWSAIRFSGSLPSRSRKCRGLFSTRGLGRGRAPGLRFPRWSLRSSAQDGGPALPQPLSHPAPSGGAGPGRRLRPHPRRLGPPQAFPRAKNVLWPSPCFRTRAAPPSRLPSVSPAPGPPAPTPTALPLSAVIQMLPVSTIRLQADRRPDHAFPISLGAA